MALDQAAAERIEDASDPRVLFGDDPGKARHRYRRLAMAVHPDTADARDRDRAAHVTSLLTTLWDRYNGRGVASGEFFTISTRRRSYAVRREGVAGGISNLYPCTWMEEGDERRGHMKIPHLPRDADLMQAEATALAAMAKGEEKFRPFVSELVESFRHRDRTTKMERRVNVTTEVEGLYSMMEVRRRFPQGLDHRDAAWMFRRLLVALGFAHDVGYVHGAVLPQNIYIQPEQHGLVLSEWCFSAPMKSKMTAWDAGDISVDPDFGTGEPFYPPEVKDKEPVSESTDLYMAAKVLEFMVGDRAPKALRAFVRGCTLEWQHMRPQNAWVLREEYDDLIERLYGPRKFRPFTMPA